jgi:hypothetical protein
LLGNKRVIDKLENIPRTVDGGEIGRDKETDELTGIFVDNAMDLVS